MFHDLSFENITIETPSDIESNYAIISINRPDRLNALTIPLVEEISTALKRCELEPEIRAVVLRGTKNYTKKPAFSVGADLGNAYPKGIKPNVPMHMSYFIQMFHREFDAYNEFSKPLIAAVDGFALGGGFEITLTCDFVIASKRSLFGLTEINRGLFPAGGGTQRLAKKIGISRAFRVLYFGETFSAEQMFKWGHVDFLANDDQFEEMVHEKVKWLGNAPTTALFSMKKCLKYGTRCEQLGLIMEQLGAGINSVSHDREEAKNAFAEKRAPQYKRY